jgi:hypothetical protein
LFYAAGRHEIDSLGVEMCRYGSMLCDNPFYVLAGAFFCRSLGSTCEHPVIRTDPLPIRSRRLIRSRSIKPAAAQPPLLPAVPGLTSCADIKLNNQVSL